VRPEACGKEDSQFSTWGLNGVKFVPGTDGHDPICIKGIPHMNIACIYYCAILNIFFSSEG
jgi:hypothetical protein